MKDQNITCSYGMNGLWSAVLRGAYNKTKKKNKFKCTVYYQAFTSRCNLSNHVKFKLLPVCRAKGAENVLPLIEHKVKFV
jgi:hypothetical protein